MKCTQGKKTICDDALLTLADDEDDGALLMVQFVLKWIEDIDKSWIRIPPKICKLLSIPYLKSPRRNQF